MVLRDRRIPLTRLLYLGDSSISSSSDPFTALALTLLNEFSSASKFSGNEADRHSLGQVVDDPCSTESLNLLPGVRRTDGQDLGS